MTTVHSYGHMSKEMYSDKKKPANEGILANILFFDR